MVGTRRWLRGASGEAGAWLALMVLEKEPRDAKLAALWADTTVVRLEARL